MRNAGGYEVIVDERGTREGDTYSCFHCNRVVRVPVKARPEDIGGLCKQCMKLICPHCVQSGRCDPLEEKLKRAEERDRVLRTYGLGS